MTLEVEKRGVTALEKENKKMDTKIKKLFSEWKYQKSQAEKLKTQNDFCIGELEHYQRQNDKLQNQLNLLNNSEDKKSFLVYEEMVKDVCKILKIKQESELINTVKAMEQAYAYLPSMQTTIEELFKIVTKNNIFNSSIDSYNDVNSCIENWALNLQDYKNLVEGLLDVLGINEEQDKTINFILENIRILIRRDEMNKVKNRSTMSVKDEENILNLCHMLKLSDSDEIVFTVNSLLDKAEFMELFVSNVKRRLDLPANWKDEDVVARISRIISEYMGAGEESATSGA